MDMRGGFARPNGITLFSSHYEVTSQASFEGPIISYRKRRSIPLWLNWPERVPFLRGIWILLKFIIKIIGAILIVCQRHWLILIFAVPVYLLVSKYVPSHDYLKEGWTAFDIIITAPLLLFLPRVINFLLAILRYHGAEHMTVNTWQNSKDLTVANISKSSRYHLYCGTRIAIAIFGLQFLLHFANIYLHPLLETLALFSIGYEIAEPGLITAKPINWLSQLLQIYVLTREPTDKMLEVAAAGMMALVGLEESGVLPAGLLVKADG